MGWGGSPAGTRPPPDPGPLVLKGSLSWAPSPGGEACSGLPGMASPPLPCPPCSPHTPPHNPVPTVPSPAPHPQTQRRHGLPSSSPADGVGALTQAGPTRLSGTQRLRGVVLWSPAEATIQGGHASNSERGAATEAPGEDSK